MRYLHWVVAVLVLVMLALGQIANSWPQDDGGALATKAMLFSAHKSLGILTFLLAILRIGWAITHHKPAPVAGTGKIFALIAETTHWGLYGALIIVPVTGWIEHAASAGYAPLWLPFGDTLPFVPQSEAVMRQMGTLHRTASKLLLAAAALHIIGALKHQYLDRDLTIARMLWGAKAPVGPDTHKNLAAALAVITWALAIVAIVVLRAPEARMPSGTELGADMGADLGQPATQAPATWTVTSGELGVTVEQFHQPLQGAFSNWTAAIAFDPDSAGPSYGDVAVEIDIASLRLGSVSNEALGPGMLSVEEYPTAHFAGPILADPETDGGYMVDGALTLVGSTLPLRLPFHLALSEDGTHARATGSASFSRMDFGIGQAYADDATFGYGITVDITIDAVKSAQAQN